MDPRDRRIQFPSGRVGVHQRPLRRSLEQLALSGNEPVTLVVCPDVQDPENLGAMLRNRAAFGVDAVLLGSDSTDPFSRRVLRVSMGAAFRVPIVESDDLERDLALLRNRWKIELWATVLCPRARRLAGAMRPPRLGLVFGSEGHGLSDRWIACCDQQFTIPMPAGTDSLNVAVASGIFLYEVMRDQQQPK